MRVPGIKRARQTIRWLRRRHRRAALILGYHRVANAPIDPFGITITPMHFSEHLETIRRIAHPISLARLLEGLVENDLPERAVVLTVDDGYVDVLYEAAPLLARYEIPVTVFVTAGYLGHSFWWDELASALWSASDLRPLLKIKVLGLTLHQQRLISDSHLEDKNDYPADLLQWLYLALRSLPVDEREDAREQIKQNLGYQAEDCARVLTDTELARLGQSELVEIGSHSLNHPVLAELTREAQQAEIRISKHRLEEILGYPVVSFSYPNGSVSATTASEVKEAGYTCACTSFQDVVRGNIDPVRLPRFWPSDVAGQDFNRWLRWWF